MENSFAINTDFTEYIKIFLEENSKLNLISKKDEEYIFQKHIYDSLAIKLFTDKYKIEPCTILDIGCGGGFPCVPISMEFPEFHITGIDSIRKKINSVENIKNKLGLTNLNLICDRVEYTKIKYDIAISRAVANLALISELALPLLKNNGYFIAYKSKKTTEEINNAKDIIAKHKAKIIDIIDYTLPTNEIYERNLIIIKKC